MLSLNQLVEADLIQTLVFDQDGSSYIQSLLNQTKYEQEISLFLQHLVYLHKNKRINLSILACHQYGNYVISLIFKLCNILDIKLLFDTFLFESIMVISESFYGSRVLMKILDILLLKKKDLLFKLIKQFKNVIIETCPKYQFSHYLKSRMNEYSSLIIQKMLELSLPYNAIKFIGDGLESHLAEFCGTIYGSRIVQKYISFYGSKLNVLQLFDDKDSYIELSKSRYGNYTIQKILAKDQAHSNLMIYDTFRNKFIFNIFTDGKKLTELSVNKHGSALMETCIKVATKQQIDTFVKTVCNNNATVLLQILHGEFGNFVARTLLRTCTDSNYQTEAQCIVNAVNTSIINLANCSKYGQSYVDAMNLQRCTSFIKHCCQWYFA